MKFGEKLRGAAGRLPRRLAIATVGAALLAGLYKPAPGEHVAVIISGANMSPAQLG